MIFVNFKIYQSGTGEEALKMAKAVELVSRESGIEMAVVVQAVDVRMVAGGVLVPVWCQHVDEVEYGAHTGWMLAEGMKEAGAVGVLLNHSERKIIQNSKSKIQNEGSFISNLERIIERCRGVGLKTLVCAADEEEAKMVLGCGPDMVAYEPPELIGGKVSVASAKPEVVSRVVELAASNAATAGQTPVLIGAGIHSENDIKVGLELGAHGFLIASDVMLAENPEERLRELVKGFQ